MQGLYVDVIVDRHGSHVFQQIFKKLPLLLRQEASTNSLGVLLSPSFIDDTDPSAGVKAEDGDEDEGDRDINSTPLPSLTFIVSDMLTELQVLHCMQLF